MMKKKMKLPKRLKQKDMPVTLSAGGDPQENPNMVQDPITGNWYDSTTPAGKAILAQVNTVDKQKDENASPELYQSLTKATNAVDKVGNTIGGNTGKDVSQIAQMTGSGASLGTTFGGPGVGTAVGAGIGLAAGIGMAVMGKKNREKENARIKRAQANAAGAVVAGDKNSDANMFSTDDSQLNFIHGMDNLKGIQKVASGGEIQGPGGPKDDVIPGKLPKGSFVVPAENADYAAAIRAAVLGDAPSKSASLKNGGGVPVRVSDGEHLFMPDEVRKIKKAGIDLNLLAPNSDRPTSSLADGGKVKTAPDTTGTKTVVVQTVDSAAQKKKEEMARLAELMRQVKASQDANRLSDVGVGGGRSLVNANGGEIRLDFGGSTAPMPKPYTDIEKEMISDWKTMSEQGFHDKWGVTSAEFQKDSTAAAKKAIQLNTVTPKKKSESVAVKSTSTGNKNLDKIVQDALASGDKKKLTEAREKVLAFDENANSIGSSNGKSAFEKLTLAMQKISNKEIFDNAEAERGSVRTEKMIAKSADLANARRPEFQKKFNQQYLKWHKYAKGILDNPQDHSASEIEEAQNIIAKLPAIVDFVKKNDPTTIEAFNKLGKLNALGFPSFFENVKDDPALIKKANDIEDSQSKTTTIPLTPLPAHNGPVSIPLTPQAGSTPGTVVVDGKQVPVGTGTVLDPTKTIAPSTTKTPKTGESKKKSTIVAAVDRGLGDVSLMPVLQAQPEAVDKIPQAPENIATTLHPEAPKQSGFAKFVESMGGPAGVASVVQFGMGMIDAASTKEPDAEVSGALLANLYENQTRQSKMDAEAKYGFDDATMNQVLKGIDVNTQNVMNTTAALDSGANTGAVLRNIAADKNDAQVKAVLESQNFMLQKQQAANANQANVNQVVGEVAGQEQRIQDRTFDIYDKNQMAASMLIGAGMNNFIDNIAYDKIDEMRKKRKAMVDNATPFKVPATTTTETTTEKH